MVALLRKKCCELTRIIALLDAASLLLFLLASDVFQTSMPVRYPSYSVKDAPVSLEVQEDIIATS